MTVGGGTAQFWNKDVGEFTKPSEQSQQSIRQFIAEVEKMEPQLEATQLVR